MTHLVIAGHGQGRSGYDPGAVNRSLGITEAGKVRELCDIMAKYSKNIHFVKDKNVFDFRYIREISKGYESVTEIHFNAFNGQANGTEVLIKAGYSPDDADNRIKQVLDKYFKARGFKSIDWLYNANSMAGTGISYRLIEICFIDNNNDMAIFERVKESLGRELVEAIENRKISVPTPKPVNQTPVQQKPKVEPAKNKGIEQMASDVMAGKYGNGDTRKQALGALYGSVQTVINERLKVISAPESHKRLAQEVLKGNLGNGETRKQNLGSYYSAVQNLINTGQVK